MDELLQKMAIEGWWVWVILLAAVTIAYLARHRVGLATLVRHWESWESEDTLKAYLGEGEEVSHLDGPIAITNKRILVRRASRGRAFAQGSLARLCNIDYSETWQVPEIVFGAIYVVLGGFAVLFSGGVAVLAVLGVVIAAVGIVILLALALFRPAALTLTFTSGRPIIISGKWDKERLAELVKATLGF